MHVAIIGGGIIGVTSAYKAISQGYKVTLLEKNKDILLGSSFQNGGQLSFSHALSTCDISIIKSLLKDSFKNEKIIDFDLLEILKNFPWVFSFVKNSFASDKRITSLFELAAKSKKSFEEFYESGDFGLEKTGTIQLFREEKSFEDFKLREKYFRKHDLEFEILGQNKLAEKVPEISNLTQFKGAAFFKDDMSGSAYDFGKKLFEKLEKNKNFKFIGGFNIKDVEFSENNIVKIRGENSEIEADNFILATGAISSKLYELLKINLPVRPLKGYSFNIDGLKLNHAIIDHDKRIVYSQINNKGRAAGLYDFKGNSEFLERNRIDYLVKNMESLFPEYSFRKKIINYWAGLRPLSRDGLPLIGGSQKYQNLFYNIGHSNLGWTLSLGSAELLVESLKERENKQLSPKRFKVL